MQLSADLGQEALLLQLARDLEEARPWFDRVPPLEPATDWTQRRPCRRIGP